MEEPAVQKKHYFFTRCHHRHSAGMTIIEVLLAILLLTTGVLAVAAMQLVGLQTSLGAGIRGGDSIAASNTMEQILSWPYDDSRLTDPDDGFHPERPDHGPYPIQSGHATIEWEIDSQLDVANLKRVFITMRRNRPNGARMAQSYDYLKSRCSFMRVLQGEAIAD